MKPGTPIQDEDLHAYLDGELTPERSREVAGWLASHPHDAARVEAWRKQGEAIHAAYDPILLEPLPKRFVQESTPCRMHRGWPLAAAAIAAVLFAGGFMAGRFVQPSALVAQETLANYGLEAHAVYVGEVRHPVEVTAKEEQHLVGWLSKRLEAPLVVPNLASDGLSLIGGRLLPADGKPCAMLMYETASGERFSLMVTSGDNKGETAFRYQENDGFGSFYWHSGEFSYALVGPADKARLLGLSRQVYEALS